MTSHGSPGGNFMTSNAKRHRKAVQRAAKFRTDEDRGEIIIADSESNEGAIFNNKTSHTPSKPSIDEQLVGLAYKDTLVSLDGFTRNPNGTIKLHKDTKRWRKEEMEMGDMEIDTPEDQSKCVIGPERTKKRKNARIGQGHEHISNAIMPIPLQRAGADVKEEWG